MRFTNSLTVVRQVAVVAAVAAAVFAGGCAEETGRLSSAMAGKTAGPPKEQTLDLGDGVTMELVLVPAGTFKMGGGVEPEDGSHHTGEWPPHLVTLSRPYYMGRYPVTQAQWRAVMGDNASRYKGDTLPVDGVRYEQAVAFCAKLAERTGRPVRLPTEAQWERACRAGSTTEFCFGDDPNALGDHAWYGKNSGGRTHPVGRKKPNAYNLYDMHGNVWEWCADWHQTDYYAKSPRVDPKGPSTDVDGHGAHVLRGGAWHVEAGYCASYVRGGDFPCGEGGPASWDNAGRAGLRVAMDAPPQD